MTEKPKFNIKNPLLACLKVNKDLTEKCDAKHTAHYEISLENSGLEYLPGDSLAVLPNNNPELVNEIINQLGFSGDEMVTDPKKQEVSLRQALTETCVITQPDKKFLTLLSEKLDPQPDWVEFLNIEKKKELADYLWGKEIIDFLEEYPEAKFEAQEFVGVLRKLNVRLYSISSSLAAKPDEVHLTVATVEYESNGKQREGVCSSWLARRIDNATEIPCFISPGKGFRLPEPEEDIPVIMIGPGTGIAPFRAFLQEREATKAKGDTWLFFGEIHEESTFFYRDEFEDYMEKGVLNKITTAFSRDQEEKIYVQHRIEEEGEEFWSYLEKGAIIYVCGDANRMAVDVDKAIRNLISQHGNKSEEETDAYMEQLKTDKRYRRDVY